MSDYINHSTHERGPFLVQIIEHDGRFYADIVRRGRRVKQTLYQGSPEAALAAAERWLVR